MDYILYCDESTSKSAYYSDFFGGCLVSSVSYDRIVNALEQKKANLNLGAELKWTKITENYADKYIEFIHFFFEFVRAGDIRVRIMFRKTENQYGFASKDDRYFKLYYQFIKHGFGFKTPFCVTGNYYLRILLDELPDSSAKSVEFKRFLCDLPNIHDMSFSGLHIRERDIGEVHSHEHILLQCVDIILGSIFFKLNKLNKAIPEGAVKRGSRTIAKEKVYKTIHNEICSIHPGFNIGISTGSRGYKYPHWESPYEHWEFNPKERVPDQP